MKDRRWRVLVPYRDENVDDESSFPRFLKLRPSRSCDICVYSRTKISSCKPHQPLCYPGKDQQKIHIVIDITRHTCTHIHARARAYERSHFSRWNFESFHHSQRDVEPGVKVERVPLLSHYRCHKSAGRVVRKAATGDKSGE